MTYHTRSDILPQLLIQNYACADWGSWVHNHTFKRSYIHRDKGSNSHTHIHTATHTHIMSHLQSLTNPCTNNTITPAETDTETETVLCQRQMVTVAFNHTVWHRSSHCHTHTHTLSHSHTRWHTVSPEAPAWSPSQPLPVHPKPGPDLWLSRQPGPTHLPASLALETRPETRDPRRRLPESPAGRSGTRTDAHGTPGSAGEISSCKELD